MRVCKLVVSETRQHLDLKSKLESMRNNQYEYNRKQEGLLFCWVTRTTGRRRSHEYND